MKKKHTITALFAAFTLAVSVGASFAAGAADGAADDTATVALTELIETVAQNEGGAAVTDRFDFDLLVGNFGAVEDAKAFDAVLTGDNPGMKLAASDKFKAYVYNGDTETAKLFTANDAAGTGHNAVFIRLTAKKNVSVQLKHPAFAVEKDSWIVQNVAFKTYYRADDSARAREIKSAELKAVQEPNDGSVTINHQGDTVEHDTYIPADALTRSANLKEGSQLYLTYAYVGSDAGARNMGLKLSIVTSEAEYVDEEPVMSRESAYGYSAMVSGTIANALYDGKTLVVPANENYPAGYEGSPFNATQTKLNEYQLMYGKLEGEIYPFSYFANVGAGASSDAVLYPTGSNSTTYLAGFQRWQMRCSDGYDAIIRITASADSLLKITHDEFATTWAMHSGIRIVAEDAEGVRVTVKNTMLRSDTDSGTGEHDNYYTDDVHMKAGDTVYLVYYTKTISSGTCPFTPSFEATAEAYDEAKRPDFEAAKAVIAARPAAVRELSAYMLGLTELRYSLESWMEIQNIFDDFSAAVYEYDTMDALNEGLASFKAQMDKVDTLVDEYDSLWSYKSEKADELLAHVSALDSKKYGKGNWGKVTEAYNNGVAAIEKAGSKVAVNNALASAKKAVDGVKKDKGCGGLAAGSSLAAGSVVLGLAALLLLKKRGGKFHA